LPDEQRDVGGGSAAWKCSIQQNKDVMVGTGGRVAIAAGGGQCAPLPERPFPRRVV